MNRINDGIALAALAHRAASEAAAYLRGVPRPDRDAWETKGHHDFVTDVDRTSEQLLRDHLLGADRSANFLGEESEPGLSAGEGLVWVVDPLDGTTNFLHGYPWWSVSIAAVLDGEPIAACVFNVPGNVSYTASAGSGAARDGASIQVSSVREPAQALIGTGFPFKTPDDMPGYLDQCARIFPATAGVRRAGSAALDLAAVACGEFDGFWELTLAPWDTAAGILLVREAGGIITGLDGDPAKVEHGGVVAGNPPMHGWLLEQVRRSDR